VGEITGGIEESGGRELDPERLGDHLDRLYGAALALTRAPHDAEDLVQETYLRVLKRPRLIRREGDLGYLLRALRNTHYSRLRSRSARPAERPVEEAARLEDTGSAQPLDVAESHQVLEAVAELPPGFRDVVIAVDLVGLSYAEAADALGMREGTVMSRLYRGRRRVAGSLGMEG
jgi:RNA polymerase sigma-70 factor (ECF subfamily)